MTTEQNQTPTRLVGKKAPEWQTDALVGTEFKTLSSQDFKGKWKVLFFYPLDFTFVCPTEIVAFDEAFAKFQELNCDVLGCSVDSKFSHLAWTKIPLVQGGIGELKIPLLADVTKKIATDFGVLLEDGMALRGLFIIDENDIVQHSTINNLSVGRNVDEILRLVEAFQYAQKYREVCPAGWSRGKEAMKPDPKGSQSWFAKHTK
ncbi:MAG: peroxiredoxin [Bdellovibrionota bacterium]